MAKSLALGADHGGFLLKEKLKTWLAGTGYKISDFGTNSKDACDYPLFGYDVALAVSKGRFDKAILVCKTGIGMAIVANKLPGVRACVCTESAQARTSREHNDCNVLSLASVYTPFNKAKKIVKTWLETKALGGRHRRRVFQIKEIEKKKHGTPAKN